MCKPAKIFNTTTDELLGLHHPDEPERFMIRLVKDITGLSYEPSEELLENNGFNIRDSIDTLKNDNL